MTGSTLARSYPASRADAPWPLSDEELAHADQVGLRLAEALRAFFAAVPTQDRSRRGYAGALKVDRNLCQRGLTGAGHASRGSEVLSRAPGLEGLDLLVAAGRKSGVKHARIAQLRAAADQLRHMIHALGHGSRPELLRRVEATLDTCPKAEGADPGRAARSRLFREAAIVTRHQCDSKSLIGVISPMPGDASRMRCAYVGAFLGYRARPGSLPVTINQTAHGKAEDNIPQGAPLRTAALVEHLCSSPPPVLSACERDGQTVNIVDAQHADPRRGVDAVISYACQYLEHPALRPPELGRFFTRIRPPMTRLVFDLYIHRDLASGTAVQAAAYAYGGGEAQAPEAVWDKLLPGALDLRVLGSGLQSAASTHWPRHAEAARWLIDRLAVNAADHIGYRLEVEFPVWGADYVIWFDYRRDKEPL